MPTSKYLDSILDVLPAVQARQINEILNDLQNKGEVRDVDEYREKVAELASLINDRLPVPFFTKVNSIMWNTASSEAHNFMMTAAKNDLESLFLQTDEIGKKVNDHHNLMMNSLISDLEKGLKDQENNIKRLEWLSDNSNEFTVAVVNSFTSTSLLSIPFSDKDAYKLYYNNRTGEGFVNVEPPGTKVDEYGEKLILSNNNKSDIFPISVTQLHDENSYGTEDPVNPDSELTNMIDGQIGTYWIRDVYLKAPVPKVSTVLKFKLGIARDIDHVYIEGAVAEDFFIEGLEAVKPDGSKEELLSESTKIKGKIRIDFPLTLAKAVICTFTQKTYHPGQYFIPKDAKVYDVFKKDNRFNTVAKVNSLSSIIRQALSTNSLSNVCNVPHDETIQVNAFLYSFGLDNVWFGHSKYQDIGVFVSSPLKITNAGVMGVKPTEKTETGTVKNSTEYDVIKIDSHPNYKETRFPIPRLNQTEVSDERLILTKKIDSSDYEDTGFFRFVPYVSPDWKDGDEEPIKLYKNGELQFFGDDWEYSISISDSGQESFDWKSSFTFAADQNNYSIVPVHMWIKISKPDPTAIYTLEYTIRTSDSFTNDQTMWLDKESTVSLSDKGRIVFKKMEEGVSVDSKLYLQVTMRRNNNSQSSSPELFDYAVLAAPYA